MYVLSSVVRFPSKRGCPDPRRQRACSRSSGSYCCEVLAARPGERVIEAVLPEEQLAVDHEVRGAEDPTLHRFVGAGAQALLGGLLTGACDQRRRIEAQRLEHLAHDLVASD